MKKKAETETATTIIQNTVRYELNFMNSRLSRHDSGKITRSISAEHSRSL